MTKIAAYNKTQLFAAYGVSRKTFEKWIVEIKTEIGWKKGQQVFSPKKVEKIFKHLGEP